MGNTRALAAVARKSWWDKGAKLEARVEAMPPNGQSRRGIRGTT